MDRDTFLKRIDDHKFPFQVDSYHKFFASMEETSSLFNEAKHGGIHFVNIFIDVMKHRIGVRINNALHEALNKQQEQLQQIARREFGTGDEEFDEFRRMCIGHDWHYDYTDDGAV